MHLVLPQSTPTTSTQPLTKRHLLSVLSPSLLTVSSTPPSQYWCPVLSQPLPSDQPRSRSPSPRVTFLPITQNPLWSKAHPSDPPALGIRQSSCLCSGAPFHPHQCAAPLQSYCTQAPKQQPSSTFLLYTGTQTSPATLLNLKLSPHRFSDRLQPQNCNVLRTLPRASLQSLSWPHAEAVGERRHVQTAYEQCGVFSFNNQTHSLYKLVHF